LPVIAEGKTELEERLAEEAEATAGDAEETPVTGLEDDCPVAPVVEVLPAAPERVWLMLINCSRLFTCTSWLMYSLGSVLAVGS
jgi:hypothetical protein